MIRAPRPISLALVLTGALCGPLSAQNAADRSIVLVTATVTGARNAPVAGLKQEDFRILEDNKEQKVSYFGSDDSPSSIGIILGAGGLAARVDTVSTAIREAVELFQKSGHAKTEYFVEPYGSDGAGGAVSRGLETLKRSPNPKKALVVIMDSHDNPGGNPDQPSMDAPMKQEVPVYFVFMKGINDDRNFPSAWLTVFEDVARNTAGRVIYAEPTNELKSECVKLAQELKGQYVIGFTPANLAQDGKWRTLKLTVNAQAGQPKLNARFRSRYMMPKAPGKE